MQLPEWHGMRLVALQLSWSSIRSLRFGTTASSPGWAPGRPSGRRELGPAENWEVLGLREQGLVLLMTGQSIEARPSRAPTGLRAGKRLQGGRAGPESFGRTRRRCPAMETPQEMRAGLHQLLAPMGSPPHCSAWWCAGRLFCSYLGEIPPNKSGWWTNNRAVAGDLY